MTTLEQEWYAGVGECLRGNRERLGWTLYDVAAIVGTTGATVSRWERGVQRLKAYQYVVLQRERLLP
jgi:transcriptional regulator with XRE-family HTH domain